MYKVVPFAHRLIDLYNSLHLLREYIILNCYKTVFSIANYYSQGWIFLSFETK